MPSGATSLVGLPTAVVQHEEGYNPFAPQYWVEGYWDYQCDELGTHCHRVWVPGYWTSDYSPPTDYRGNVTQVTAYANAGLDPADGAVTEPVVDLSVEFSNMIMAQRSFEANERTIETARDMYQAALQIGK